MPQGAPSAQPPGPSRPAKAPSYLSASSAAGVAGSAGCPGPGPGGGGRGCRAGGERQGEGRVGRYGAQGEQGGRWQPQGLRAGPAEPKEVRDAGSAEGRRGPDQGSRGSLLGPAVRSSLQGRPGTRQGAGREAPLPGSRGQGARIRGAVLSPRLTNQSGPAELGDCHRRCGARGSPAGPRCQLTAASSPRGPRVAGWAAVISCGRVRPGAGAAGRGRRSTGRRRPRSRYPSASPARRRP